MKRRCEILLLTALLAGATGCASTARRDTATPIFGSSAWNDAPAPPQKAVVLTAARSDQTTDPAPARVGLAKYFPGLVRNAPEPPKVAAVVKPRPTWFGLWKPKPTVPTTYMTDAREQLNRSSGPLPTALPVALQVPTDRSSSDRQVIPTSAERTAAEPPAQPTKANEDATPTVPDFGGKPSKPGEDEVNPLPPAAEPGSANRMPPVPAVDPLDKTEAVHPEPKKAPLDDDAASDDQAVKVSSPESEATSAEDQPKPKPAATPVTETAKLVVSSQAPTQATTPASPVLASPQVASAKPAPHVHATSQIKPSPQGADATAKTWRRPCLRRLVRRVGKLGEFASPPTAAPH